MTDLPPPTDDDLSLALDGEADADLLARIEASPGARARLEELRAAQSLLASSTVAALDDDVVDDLIASAVDTPIAPQHQRTRRPRGAAPWLVAAAVIVLMAIGLSLVWAGRSSDQDKADASFDAVGAEIEQQAGDAGADSSFSERSSGGRSAPDTVSGGHGAATTSGSPSASADTPLLYLGAYASADDLRAATATSLADAQTNGETGLAFGSPSPESGDATGFSAEDPPERAGVDRCAEQLQVTLSMKAAPLQTGYATVDGKDVLVYEFATASARDADRETTLVAAVGADACDQVVIFER